ncbi:phosphate ABC transporter permease PstA [Thiolinea disciformis]|uniref:phosphate ABC transporter permease PstA n=1 Tax=Thiolinea disciformis TaxID=125614 RepID=UPI00035F04CE|nr:phosphate ABC transporter permease PstA [Thiolinea disciformis]
MSNATAIVKAGLTKRYARERRFRLFGLVSIVISLSFLAALLITIFAQGLPALRQTYIQLPVNLDPALLAVNASDSPELLQKAKYAKAIEAALIERFPGVTDRKQKMALIRGLLSKSADNELKSQVLANPKLIGSQQNFWFLANDDIDTYIKGNIDRSLPEADRRIKDFQLAWLDDLEAKGQIEKRFNTVFFTSGDSREPEQAGVLGALMGSFYTMFVTLALSFPLAVAAAIYLEEFAPKNNPLVDFIEVNINNLAAVPSIVFGLLGLAVFIQFFGVPRSTPLVGGLVLSLQTLPIIIIAARAALKAVPPSIRQAAYGMGASRMQTVFHHTLPLAMPGILTGTILGMAHALGETAPLLMVGMVAFIMSVPEGITDPATILPVQIYLWSDSPERAFVEKTSAAIIVLLFFLILMNLLAVLLRKKFERRW